MKKFYKRLVQALPILLCFTITQALETDQVRGEIVDVDHDAKTVAVRIEETGDAVPARVGQTEVYEIDASTNVEFEFGEQSVLSDRLLSGFEDLEAGQEVVVDYRLLGERRIAVTFIPIAVYMEKTEDAM